MSRKKLRIRQPGPKGNIPIWVIVLHGGYKYYVDGKRRAWHMARRFIKRHRRVYGVRENR
jgi:hypothetical protein